MKDLSLQQIGNRLNISPQRVKDHIDSILPKLFNKLLPTFESDACECVLAMSSIFGIEIEKLVKKLKKDKEIFLILKSQARVKYGNMIKDENDEDKIMDNWFE